MLVSLPARPLSPQEVDALSENEALELAFPATPQSIRETKERQQRIYDLLLFLGETVAAVAYRVYEAIDREDAMKQVITKLYGLPEGLVEAELEEFGSLEDGG